MDRPTSAWSALSNRTWPLNPSNLEYDLNEQWGQVTNGSPISHHLNSVNEVAGTLGAIAENASTAEQNERRYGQPRPRLTVRFSNPRC